MKKVIEFFVRKPIWANALIFLSVIFGVIALYSIPNSFFPELPPNRISISVSYPGASPKEMEEGITIKIEEALQGINGIEETYSSSSENYVRLTVIAYQDADLEEVATEVKNAVDAINSFPEGAEKPIVVKQKTGSMGTVAAWITLTGDMDMIELKSIAQEVEDDLLLSGRISQVRMSGVPATEFSIEIEEDELLRYNLRFDEVVDAVRRNNIDLSAGAIKTRNEELLIRTRGRKSTIDEINRIVVRSMASGQYITVGDVADVKFQFEDTPYRSFMNEKQSIVFTIEKLPSEDLGEISGELDRFIEEFNETHDNAELITMFQFYDMLQQRIDLLIDNGLIGLFMVLFTLGLFLNLRLSAWVAFGIPFSFLGMFIIGFMYGITINMISLFAMILVVGILVDDGIVIAENIYAHFEKGKTPYNAVIDGTMEVLPAVFTSILTTIVAFSVLMFIEGLEMMAEMAFVVMASLGFSLIEAFLILPSHLSHKKILMGEPLNKSRGYFNILGSVICFALAWVLINRVTEGNVSFFVLVVITLLILTGLILFIQAVGRTGAENFLRKNVDKFISVLRDKWYGYLLRSVLKRYWLSAFTPLLFIIIVFSLMGNGIIQTTFFPAIPFDDFKVEVAFKPGEREDKTQAFLEMCEGKVLEVAKELKEETGEDLIKYTTVEVGYTESLGENGGNCGLVRVSLDVEGKGISSFEIVRRVKEKIGDVKGAEKFIVGGQDRWGKPVSIGLRGKDYNEIKEASVFLKEELKKTNKLSNITQNNAIGKRELNLHLKPKAYMLGLNHAAIVGQIRQGFFGDEAQRLIVGTDEVKVWVRYPENDRSSLGQLENMKIKTADGKRYPLNSLVDYTIERGEVSIKRYDGAREILIEADLADAYGSATQVLGDIKSDIIPVLKSTFPGIKVTYRGQQRRAEKSTKSGGVMLMVALFLMFLIISLNFNSVYQSLIIMAVIPAGVAGSILGHGLENLPVSTLSAWGMIALLGILVNDAVVFLDTYNRGLKEGLNVKDSIYKAGVSRFRPIVLTSITTIAGLYPLILEESFQAQFLIPMAVSVAYGVLFGTSFILLFFPVLVLIMNDMKRAIRWVWTGVKPSKEEVEPTIVDIRRLEEINEMR